ncbi:MAG: TetR/AcrR family transcriptional regulator [Solirubrobacterales bacterium]|nr:TetR/AcrR family transcriptional regulator [Solirubrobacterales bacterium]
MIVAMTEHMARHGYGATRVADIVEGAGVSRESFYAQFASKEACFMAAYDDAVAWTLTRSVEQVATRESSPARRFAAGLRAFLETVGAAPDAARLFLIEVYAVGPKATARRAAAQQEFTELVVRELACETDAERFAAEALVAAVGAMVTTRLAAGEADTIPALYEPVLALAQRLLPL